jgi:hypothetical protein
MISMKTRLTLSLVVLTAAFALSAFASPRVEAAGNSILDKQEMLDRQTWWDNKDWDWYKENIPFFESPDGEIDTTYYYRWEVITKHLVYGSPETGYTFTEFIDRPGWSGTYGAISCPLGHHFYELRWLKDRRVPEDYARYWFHTPGAQPRSYSNWFADSMWGMYETWGDEEFILSMLPDMERQYEGWVREHFDAEQGMFKWHGMADGMETNINSRQTKNGFAGGEGFRPTLNSYLYADALAISQTAALAGDEAKSQAYADKAAKIKKNVQKKLWDPNRDFFFHMFANDEKDGVKAGTLTYQTGKYAGDTHGREEIGFIPWQFNLPDDGYEAAWRFLMDEEYFFSAFGPTVVERHDPLFHISANCCAWSGNSWPFATTQTLQAMANLLNNYKQDVVDKADYYKLLKTYTMSHRMDGRPYIAEACHPDTGSWSGHNVFNHSEHYFHSGYLDLVITGLVGLRPRADDVIEVNPLVPDDWDFFLLDEVAYHGLNVSIVWDRDGSKYGKGKGLMIFADGQLLASSPVITRLEAKLPKAATPTEADRPINFAVNNDGGFFPAVRASFTNPAAPVTPVNDGNYWYHPLPPNRWTCEDSPNKTDWIEVEFGAARPIEAVKLYFLDDSNESKGGQVKAPTQYDLLYWDGKQWADIPGQQRNCEKPEGHRANVVTFPKLNAEKIRVRFTHTPGSFTGLTEIEAWGHADLPLSKPTAEIRDLAFNGGDKEYPKASASFTSRFDRIDEINDGKSFFTTNSRNRWTAFESPNASDWVEIDFGAKKTVRTVDIHMWGDRGNVRAPKDYRIEYWDGQQWTEAPNQKRSPATPAVMAVNTAKFDPITTDKLRVVFTHDLPSFSGVTELMIWEE